MFLSVCFSSTLQKTVSFNKVALTEVNRSVKYRMDASGKAINTARILAQLEPASVTCLCPLGKENASYFEKLAAKDGLKVCSVLIPGFTRECVTLLDSSSHTTTELVVGEPELSYDTEKASLRFLKLFRKTLKNQKAVIIAGSRPQVWSQELQAQLCSETVNSGRLLLADFWGKDLLNVLKTCTPQIIKINEEEFCSTFGLSFPLNEDQLKEEICRKSRELSNILIITRGTDPTFAANKGEFYSCPIEKLVPVNTTACGDSFNAGFIYEYVKTSDMDKALQKGTWCAARNALSEIPGTIR